MGLREDLAALDRAYSAGHHGLWMARRRSDLLDAALIRGFGEAGAPTGVGLAAIGGFGRQQQLPHSDVDLLIVHGGSADEADVAGFVERLLYPLWDDGLEVGQAVRTRMSASRSPGSASTRSPPCSICDGWRATGACWTTFTDASSRPCALSPVRSRRSLREAAEARRRRYGSVAHLLRPELKEGEGGLRDVASLGWLAHAIGPLETAGLLREREREAVDDAAEFLTRVRSALHLETGRARGPPAPGSAAPRRPRDGIRGPPGS